MMPVVEIAASTAHPVNYLVIQLKFTSFEHHTVLHMVSLEQTAGYDTVISTNS